MVAFVLVLLLALAGCGGDDVQAGDLHGNVLDPPFTVSEDALVDTDGDAYSLADSTDKRLTLVFFGYTNCPDICGVVMNNLASAMTRAACSWSMCRNWNTPGGRPAAAKACA